MPDRSKVRWSQLRVGVVALTALSILFVMVFSADQHQGRLPARRHCCARTWTTLRACRRHGGAAQRHHRRLPGPAAADRFARSQARRGVRHAGAAGVSDADIPVDSVAGIGAANLLGDKFLNITKGHSAETCAGRRRAEAACARRTFPNCWSRWPICSNRSRPL